MEWEAKDLSIYPPHLLPRLKKGQGLRNGKHYRGWDDLRHGSLKGTIGQPLGIWHKRPLDLRSTQHRTYFFLRERQAHVIDIRERWPILNIAESLKLCAELDIKHPAREGFPEPILIDFLITRRQGDGVIHEARTLGSEAPFNKLLEIWCSSKGLQWKAVDKEPLSADVLRSLIFMRGWHRHRYAPERTQVEAFANLFLTLHSDFATMKETLLKVSKRLRQPLPQCTDHFRYASWAGYLRPDPTRLLQLNAPVVLMT